MCSKLAIDAEASFFLNLGNNHPNIAMHVEHINGLDDYESTRSHLAEGVSSADDFKKTIVFTNTVNRTQRTCKKVCEFFPKSLRKYVDYLHAHQMLAAKKRVMQRFHQGKVKILIATEAAGMVSKVACCGMRFG